MFMALLKDGIVPFYISKGLIRHALVLNLTYKEMGISRNPGHLHNTRSCCPGTDLVNV